MTEIECQTRSVRLKNDLDLSNMLAAWLLLMVFLPFVEVGIVRSG